MTITVEIDTGKILKDFDNDFVDEEGLIRELTLKGQKHCKIEVPKDTGDLSRSINVRIEGNEGIVKTDLEYARHVIYGTHAHEIKVKNKKVLSDRNSDSPKKKDVIYGPKVMHPGTKANNFPARAVKKVQAEMPGSVRKYMKVKS